MAVQALRMLKDAGRLGTADIETLLASADDVLRCEALYAALALPQFQSPELLLEDPSPQVRKYAVLCFRRRGQAARGLLLRLRREDDPEVVSALVGVLRCVGDEDALPALIEATRHADAFVRQDSAAALGDLRDARAIPALESLLGDTTKPERRYKDGSGGVISGRTVAESAREALGRIRRG